MNTTVKLKMIGKADDCSSAAFIFHHVGGDGTSFREYANTLTLNASLSVYLVVLPGRALSRKEQVLRSIPAAADQVYTALMGEVEKVPALHKVPCLFFGHSYGGIVAYEVIRRLAVALDPCLHVRHLVVSCVRSPDGLTHMNMQATSDPQQTPDWLIHKRTDEGVIDHLRELQGGKLGVDTRFILNKLHAIRADFQAFETYMNCNVSGDQGNGALPLRIPCDITAFYGSDDHKVPQTEVLDWCRFTEPGYGFGYVQFDGGHFYLFDETTKDTVAARLRDLCLAPIKALPSAQEPSSGQGIPSEQKAPQNTERWQDWTKMESLSSAGPLPVPQQTRESARQDPDAGPAAALPPLSPFVAPGPCGEGGAVQAASVTSPAPSASDRSWGITPLLSSGAVLPLGVGYEASK